MKERAINDAEFEAKCKVRKAVIIAVWMLTLSIGQAVQAQNASIYAGTNEVTDYLRTKYKVDHVQSTLQKTTNGPSGSFVLIGDITPKNADGGASKDERLRNIAKKLIAQEPNVFGIPDANELSETSFAVDELGYTHIGYRRVIAGLPLVGTNIDVHIGPDEHVFSVNAHILPYQVARYHTLSRETLDQSAVMQIIEADLAEAGITYDYNAVNIFNAEKVAVTYEPYVIWTADVQLDGKGRWKYRIDALSGKLIRKEDALVE